MTSHDFDDAALQLAMGGYLDCVRRLEEISSLGGEARALLDLAEGKTLAALQLRKRLVELGWTAPAPAAAQAPTR